MSDTFRASPSGPSLLASGSGAVESVYGRQGDVLGDVGDYDTDQVDNESGVPGATLSDALDHLLESDGRANDSLVPGSTVSEALDWLDANIAPAPRGSLLDTFCGGQSTTITAPQATGNLGDLGWNVFTFTSSSGWSISRLPPEAGVVGAIRLTSATTAFASGGGPSIVYGFLDLTQDDGPLTWADVGEIYFRARTNPNPTGPSGSVLASWGVIGHDGTSSVGVAFFANILGLPPTSANFQVQSGTNPGVTLSTDTGVPIDDDYHDFVIRRVDANTIEFLIDDAVVATHTGGSVPTGSSNITFRAGIASADAPTLNRQTYLDLDTFEFTPA